MTDKLSPKGLVGLCQSEEGGIQSTRKRKTNYEDVGCCSGKAMAVVVDQECEMYLAAGWRDSGEGDKAGILDQIEKDSEMPC